MRPPHRVSASRSLGRLCIWTLEHQRRVTVGLAMGAGGATGLLGVLVLLGRLTPMAASQAIGLGAVSLGLLVWLLLQARKEVLLGIQDPDLRRAAHRAMLTYICARSPVHCPRPEETDGAGEELSSRASR